MTRVASFCSEESSVYVQGADDLFGFGGGENVPLDGCYEYVDLEEGDDHDATRPSHGYCVNGLTGDGPCFTSTSTTDWLLSNFESIGYGNGLYVLQPVGSVFMAGNGSLFNPANVDTESWYHWLFDVEGTTLTEGQVCVTCGCSFVSECVSPSVISDDDTIVEEDDVISEEDDVAAKEEDDVTVEEEEDVIVEGDDVIAEEDDVIAEDNDVIAEDVVADGPSGDSESSSSSTGVIIGSSIGAFSLIAIIVGCLVKHRKKCCKLVSKKKSTNSGPGSEVNVDVSVETLDI